MKISKINRIWRDPDLTFGIKRREQHFSVVSRNFKVDQGTLGKKRKNSSRATDGQGDDYTSYLMER